MNDPAGRGKRALRVFPPWDLLRGRDVFRDKQQLRSELDLAFFQHWAPNCGTFSRARDHPIPGVVNPPIPLRSDLYPKGIPSVLDSLPPSKRRKVELDTHMAEMAAAECLEAHRSGRHFSLENPKNSIARQLESWKELEGESGVYSTEYHACMFAECRRRKAQVLIHNVAPLHHKIGKLCAPSGRCTRTKLPHLSWRPRVVNGKVTSFATGQEREYPRGFCEEFAAAAASVLSEDGASFVEIFSGGNAPLSQSIAATCGVEVPNPEESLVGATGTTAEFSESAAARPDKPQNKRSETTGEAEPTAPAAGESSAYRLAAVQSGKQPSYGKRQQLIPDGLQSAADHLERAKKLEHPFNSLQALKEDHRKALESIKADPQKVINGRFESLEMIKAWELSLRHKQSAENSKASWTAKKLGCKPNTLLMRRLQELLNIEDRLVPDLCLSGIPNRSGKTKSYKKDNRLFPDY